MTTRVYEHYKGGTYFLLHLAKHTETDELLAIYKNNQGEVFARPFDMFIGKVNMDGKEVFRFRYVGEMDI